MKGSTEDQNQSLIRRLDLPITLRVVRGGFVMGDLISSAQFFNLFIPKRCSIVRQYNFKKAKMRNFIFLDEVCNRRGSGFLQWYRFYPFRVELCCSEYPDISPRRGIPTPFKGRLFTSRGYVGSLKKKIRFGRKKMYKYSYPPPVKTLP